MEDVYLYRHIFPMRTFLFRVLFPVLLLFQRTISFFCRFTCLIMYPLVFMVRTIHPISTQSITLGLMPSSATMLMLLLQCMQFMNMSTASGCFMIMVDILYFQDVTFRSSIWHCILYLHYENNVSCFCDVQPTKLW